MGLQLRRLVSLCLASLAVGCGGSSPASPAVARGSCLGIDCSGLGTCSLVDDLPVCACAPGYAAPFCATCAAGFHRSAATFECVADQRCAEADPCGAHGTCSDEGGAIACACAAGYAGDTCAECAAGFHPEAGGCALDQQCLPPTCSGAGTCSVSGGVVQCACATGYAGTYCEACAPDYSRSGAECVSDACPVVPCSLYCPNGFQVDGRGCELCLCN